MSSTHLATALVARFEHLRMTDVEAVGGKNASLGEMISQLSQSGVRVPGGFATTAHAFRQFLAEGGLAERIARAPRPRSTPTTCAPSPRPAPRSAAGSSSSRSRRRSRRRSAASSSGSRPTAPARPSRCARRPPPRTCPTRRSPASRRPSSTSSASTRCWRRCARSSPASTTTAPSATACTRAIAHGDVALSAGVQRMVRSDLGAAGVMFTIDTESGFTDVVFITSSYGLGETVVQGAVNPDEFYVHKPALQRRQAGDHPPQPRLQADPHGVRLGRGAARAAASW